MKLRIFILLFLSSIMFAQGQQLNVGPGIVNKYAGVDSFITQCEIKGDSLELSQFKRGDKILIIQMKGASFDTSYSASFGTVSGFGYAGMCEVNQVDTVLGDTLYLRFQTINPYECYNSVQIVSIPTAPRINVVADIRAKSWDKRSGGVLILNAIDSLIINGNIRADSAGFRGGNTSTPYVHCNTTAYVLSDLVNSGGPENSGQKGESYINLPRTMGRGRAPGASGGGGGNNHNTGGGGGGNFGSGGMGGKESTNCSGPGITPMAVGGLGGLSTAYTNNFNRYLMGSGGGGAHQNDVFDGSAVGGYGGHGGGLIILRANRMIYPSTSFIISANGGNCDTITGRDGSGGGGGGGSIVLDINNYSGQLRASAVGGRGGRVNNKNLNQSHGPGGGGGGGVVMFKGATPPGAFLVTTGGASGTIVNTQSPDFGTTYGASAGTAGGTVTGVSIPNATVRCSNVIVFASNDTVSTFVNFPANVLPRLNDVYTNAVQLSILRGPFHGSAFISPTNDTVKYTPQNFFSGVDSIRYMICDNFNSICDSATIVINIIPFNLLAINDTATTTQNFPVWVRPLINDLYPNGSPYTFSVIQGPRHGTYIRTTGDSVQYTPTNGYTGKDTMMYNLCVSTGGIPLCDTALIIINVNPLQVIAVDDTASTQKNYPVIFNPLINDLVPPGSSVQILCPPKRGTAQVLAGNNIRYSPGLNVTGKDTMCYVVCAPTPTTPICDTAFIFINISGLPFKAVDDTARGPVNTPITVNPLVNDTIINPTNISIGGCVPKHGSVSIGAGNTLIYTPVPGFTGNDTACYIICHSAPVGAVCDTAHVFITIDPMNLFAIDDTVSTRMNTGVWIYPKRNDIFNGNPSISIIPNRGPFNGTANSPVGDSLYYLPNPGFTGSDTIRYRLCTNTAIPFCDTATIVIKINPVNLKAINDSALTIVNTPVTVPILQNDTRPGTVTITIITPPSRGTATQVGDSIQYIPVNSFFGRDSLKYKICYPTSYPLLPICDEAWVYIDVVRPNLRARNDAVTIYERDSININFLKNDTKPSGYPLTVTILNTAPYQLKLGTYTSYGSNDSILYKHVNGIGVDSVQYMICIPLPTGDFCDTATIRITVLKILYRPIAKNDTLITRANTPGTINPVLNDFDPNGSPLLNLSPYWGPINGSIVQNQNQLIYTPSQDFVGRDSLYYRICNSLNPPLCDSAVIYFYVLPADSVVIPNGYSPNGDGVNDFFVIKNIRQYSNPDLTIYNRWGNEVWRGKPYRDQWSGDNQNNDPLPDGTYYYILDLGNGLPVYKGFIVLQR